MAEAHPVMELDKVQGVAGLSALARHAAEESFARGDDQVGGFLVVVEGTESRPVLSLLFEFYASGLDQGDEVGFLFDSVDFGFGYAWHWLGVWV